MKLSFAEYHSIENVSPKNIGNIKKKLCDENVEWVAMEKIHGANISAITDGKDILWCRRNSILKEKERFFNYEQISQSIGYLIKDLFLKIKSYVPDLKQLQVFGELFGGNYPHSDVPEIKGISQVQSKIYYHPDNKFMIFDAVYTLDDSKEKKYLGYDDLIKYLVETSDLLKFCPILKRGKLDDLLKMNPCFQTTIPDLYGLPKIENNYAEGWVFKTANPTHLQPYENAPYKNEVRFTLKLKREDFLEKKNDSKLAKQFAQKSNMKNIMLLYLNESRLASVKSKLTDEERENEELMIDKLLEDAWIDIKKDYDITFDTTSISKNIKKYCEEKFF